MKRFSSLIANYTLRYFKPLLLRMIVTLGPDDTHLIHQRKATTVILQENNADEAIAATIPKPSTKNAVQVEELGSYKLETQEQSFSYRLNDMDGTKNHAIIDEMDSDSDISAAARKTLLVQRNISINSVNSDDAGIPSASKTCELTVNQMTKNIPFEDVITLHYVLLLCFYSTCLFILSHYLAINLTFNSINC